jgi:KDO2-lipid IV(A) lauroyltransferase
LAKRKRKKGKAAHLAEYALARAVMGLVGLMPMWACRALSSLLGNVLYYGSSKRRGIALENLRHAFGSERSDDALKRIARRSCASFLLTFMEMIKFRPLFDKPEALKDPKYTNSQIFTVFEKVRKTHESSGGAIFVTPHMGNWEVLPHVCTALGIPLVVVARPPDNPYLRKLLFEDRTATGQVVIPKKNALYTLRKALRDGKSLGLLPDQATKHGVAADFFGRKALTTPIPALLSITYKRPIVVAAACRTGEGLRFEGYVSDPIMPGEYESERQEIVRLTGEMNRAMEHIIRKHPGQYLWIHNRWKTYADAKAFSEDEED